jgi:hypothetical protein
VECRRLVREDVAGILSAKEDRLVRGITTEKEIQLVVKQQDTDVTC